MEEDPDVEYWVPFVKRMKNIPMEYQLAILEEYEKAENAGIGMDVEIMWDLLLAGEEEARFVKMKQSNSN